MNNLHNHRPNAGSNSRRHFLKSSLAAIATPVIVPASALGRQDKTPPSDRITVGIIGCGKMAKDFHIPELLRFDDVQIVAVCDVDTTRRDHALQRVNESYAEKNLKRVCDAYNDYREIISRDDIDAVCIATPDHWHATPLIEACQAGKDVYCEKPLTLTIAEAKRCIDAARKYERVVQTGSQQRSNSMGSFREAVEIIRSGRLGKIRRVNVGVGAPSSPCDLPGEELEPGLDWNMWLGQAPLRPYNSILSPCGVHDHFPAWRSYQEYSGGGHTDMGAHHYDIAQWALQWDHSGPSQIVPPEDADATTGVRFIFPGGIEVIHGGRSGCEFHGENGWLYINRGVLESEPASIVAEPLGEDDVKLYHSPGHHRNWLDCIRSRETPVADVEYGARTVTIVHLGNLAYWHRRTFEWDPKNWVFGDAADNTLLDRERRDPWQLPEV